MYPDEAIYTSVLHDKINLALSTMDKTNTVLSLEQYRDLPFSDYTYKFEKSNKGVAHDD